MLSDLDVSICYDSRTHCHSEKSSWKEEPDGLAPEIARDIITRRLPALFLCVGLHSPHLVLTKARANNASRELQRVNFRAV
jgi:hypothetical protein